MPLAIEYLCRILEPVEQQRGEHEQLVKDTIGRQHHCTAFRAEPREGRDCDHEDHGPQEEVAVDREEWLERRQRNRSTVAQSFAKVRSGEADHDSGAHRQLGEFCDEARPADPGNTPIDAQRQPQPERNVQQVVGHLDSQHRLHSSPPDEEADDGKIGEHGRRAPVADIGIDHGSSADLALCAQRVEQSRQQDRLRQQ